MERLCKRPYMASHKANPGPCRAPIAREVPGLSDASRATVAREPSIPQE